MRARGSATRPTSNSALQATIGAYRLKHNQAARHFLKGGRVYKEPKQRKDRVAGAAVIAPAIVIRHRKG